MTASDSSGKSSGARLLGHGGQDPEKCELGRSTPGACPGGGNLVAALGILGERNFCWRGLFPTLASLVKDSETNLPIAAENLSGRTLVA